MKDGKGDKDGEDISGAEEPSCDVAGGYRFENMIKSMLARLELNNSLAPIQEYGRHQKRANKIKKKEAPKKKPDGPTDGEDQNATTADAASGEKEKPTQPKDFQDDKFYDLDDDWIDDGDIEIHDNLEDEIHLGDGASAFFTENLMNEPGSSLNKIMASAEGEE